MIASSSDISAVCTMKAWHSYRKRIDRGSTLSIEDSTNSIKASHCYSQNCKHHHYHPRALLAHWLATVLPYIIHQPDFEGLFSEEEITSLKKLLRRRAASKRCNCPQLLPCTKAKALVEALEQQHHNS